MRDFAVADCPRLARGGPSPWIARMNLITTLLFLAGFVLLVGGAEMLVRGASRLATGFGISELVVGLTVVGLGTSAPEFAVSMDAAVHGGTYANLALSNIVGSNIFNILVVLGVSAAVVPIVIASRLVRLEVPLMVVAALAMFLAAANGTVGRLEGLALFAGLLAYMAFTVFQSVRIRREARRARSPDVQPSPSTIALDLVLVVAGLVTLVLGARWVVDGSIELARLLGVSETVIGLTLVAGGTSLPEVATSVVAAFRGRGDIAVGNVVGSCIFNSLGVLGLAAALAPAGIVAPESVIAFDGPIMLAVSVACLPIFITGFRVSRAEGLLFFGYYIAYVAFLAMEAAHFRATTLYGDIMLFVVMPLTVLTLAWGVWRQVRNNASSPSR